MSQQLLIEIDWERLERGRPEERATFGALGIKLDDTWLTEAQDSFVGRVREKVYMSGYQLAYWLAWNWWRLEIETKRDSMSWKLAHRLPNIGGGYIWPNIEIASDGQFVLISAKPSKHTGSEPLRYISDAKAAVSLSEYRASASNFIEAVLYQLRSKGLNKTPLEQTWNDLREERSDSQQELYRRIEAALGFDPDEAPQETTGRLLQETATLGKNGVEELCSVQASSDRPVPEAEKLFEIADSEGHALRFSDIPRINQENFASLPKNARAWVTGQAAARVMREQERLGEGLISNKKLCQLSGTSTEVLNSTTRFTDFSFALKHNGDDARIVIAKKSETGQRFALARMLGDRILQNTDDPLVPILESKTYRQKAQRSFAAEFLCPFDCALESLRGDFSDEKQEAVAEEYKVSPLLVCTQLVNNGHLERVSLDSF